MIFSTPTSYKYLPLFSLEHLVYDKDTDSATRMLRFIVHDTKMGVK